MFQKLIDLIRQTNPNYYATFDEASMIEVMNDYANGASGGSAPTDPEFPVPDPLEGFACIEEYQEGNYSDASYWRAKTTRVQIWFCKIVEGENRATQRHSLRQEIEAEIVLPFMDTMSRSGLFALIDTWDWYTLPPHYHESEVSIMIEADLKELSC